MFSQKNKNQLNTFKLKLQNTSQTFLNKQTYKLKLLEKTSINIDPINIMKRGYTITRKNGKLIRSFSELQENDVIETILKDGSVKSKVQ